MSCLDATNRLTSRPKCHLYTNEVGTDNDWLFLSRPTSGTHTPSHRQTLVVVAVDRSGGDGRRLDQAAVSSAGSCRDAGTRRRRQDDRSLPAQVRRVHTDAADDRLQLREGARKSG